MACPPMCSSTGAASTARACSSAASSSSGVGSRSGPGEAAPGGGPAGSLGGSSRGTYSPLGVQIVLILLSSGSTTYREEGGRAAVRDSPPGHRSRCVGLTGEPVTGRPTNGAPPCAVSASREPDPPTERLMRRFPQPTPGSASGSGPERYAGSE